MKIAGNQLDEEYLKSSNTIQTNLISGAGVIVSSEDSSNYSVELYVNFYGWKRDTFLSQDVGTGSNPSRTGLYSSNIYWDTLESGTNRFPIKTLGQHYTLEKLYTTNDTFVSDSGQISGEAGLVLQIKKGSTTDPTIGHLGLTSLKIGDVTYNASDANYYYYASSWEYWVWPYDTIVDRANKFVDNQKVTFELR